MKTLITAIALTVTLATPVFASSDHDNENGNDMNASEMQGGMMDHEHMKKMHEHMQEMQKLMAEIKQESDPKIHHTLMHKHMESMQQGMGMMNGQMKGKHGMKDQMDMSSMQMKDRMDMMEKRVNMMQMMMGQMMQHKTEEEKQRKHSKQVTLKNTIH